MEDGLVITIYTIRFGDVGEWISVNLASRLIITILSLALSLIYHINVLVSYALEK